MPADDYPMDEPPGREPEAGHQQRLVTRAYEILWTSLVARIFAVEDGFVVECHDKFGQKPEDCLKVWRQTEDAAREYVTRRYGQCDFKSS